MDDISPEDRERLAKTKFGEWFEEFWDKKFGESFDKRVTESYSATGKPQPTSPPQPTLERPAQKQRRRSLLEECFSQSFGMS